MEQKEQVFFTIKRTIDTQEGRLLSYLQTEPFDLGTLPEIVMLTLKQHWSPFAMSADGVDSEPLRQRAIWAIQQLEAQAALIRTVFLEPSVVKTETETSRGETQAQAQQANGVESSLHQTQTEEVQALEHRDDDEIDDDETDDDETDVEWIDIKPSLEMQQINKLFGIG